MATRQTTDFPAGGILTDTMLDNEFNEIYTNITDANIAAGANIAISKTALGTYTTPTITFSPTIYKADNSTSLTKTDVYSTYTQIGKLVVWTYVGSINNSQSPGTNIFLTLPVSGISTGQTLCVGHGVITHSGNTGGWPMTVLLKSDGTRIISNTSSDRNTLASWNDYTTLVVYFTATYIAA